MKLLRALVILTVVAGLVLGTVLPALADSGVTSSQPSLSLRPDDGKPPWAGGKMKVIRGEVKEDPDENKVEVILKSGEEIEILVDEETRYRVPGLGKASLEDIREGMQIVAVVNDRDGELYARHIVVIHGRPLFSHHVGEVTAYPGDSITIKDKKGNEVTFQIIDDKFKILPPGTTEEDIEIGKWVTVISRRDPATDVLIAMGVVLHPERPRLALFRLLKHLRWRGLERIVGTITNIEDEGGITITIDPTPAGDEGDEVTLRCDDKTTLILRGVVSLDLEEYEEKDGIAFYREREDETPLARIVVVGIGSSEIDEMEEP